MAGKTSGSRSARPTLVDFVEPEHELVVTTTEIFGTPDVIQRFAVSTHKWIEVVVRPNGARSVWGIGRWFDSVREAIDWLAEVEASKPDTQRAALVPCANVDNGCEAMVVPALSSDGRVLCGRCWRNEHRR